MMGGVVGAGGHKLNQHKSSLTAAEIAQGMNAVRANARALYEDAALLYENGRYPRAFALAALAIEEAGKQSILRGLAMDISADETKATWRRFRSHREKNTAWVLPDFVAAGARKLGDFDAMYQPEAEHTAILDQLKQLAFYVDCLGNRHWSIPADVVDASLCDALLRTADLLTRDKVVTALEIELWITHMRPVRYSPLPLQQAALLNWRAAMVEHGLAEAEDEAWSAYVGLDFDPDEVAPA
jgi:AbiV family abortive infection protein